MRARSYAIVALFTHNLQTYDASQLLIRIIGKQCMQRAMQL